MGLRRDLYILTYALSNNVPQEWRVSQSNQTTCQGPTVFIRVNDPFHFKNKPLCLIQVKDSEVVISSPFILLPSVSKVIRIIKIAMNDNMIPTRCLTLTECPLTCETCKKALEFYEEPFKPYEEILITP